MPTGMCNIKGAINNGAVASVGSHIETPPLRENEPSGNQSVVSKCLKNKRSKLETSLLAFTT